jgi:hypothetical protein
MLRGKRYERDVKTARRNMQAILGPDSPCVAAFDGIGRWYGKQGNLEAALPYFQRDETHHWLGQCIREAGKGG